MCFGGGVMKPQGEPGAKPAHTAHFLDSRVIGWELMSCAFGTWCPKPPGETRDKTSSQCTCILFPCHWLGAHVRCSGDLVSKPQEKAETKPAQTVHCLHSRVIGLE